MQKISHYAALAALAIAGATLPATPAFAQDKDKVQYKEVARDDMPKEVRHEADAQARDAKDIKYQQQLRDGKTFYSVHFTQANGKRMEVRLDEQGKVVDGPHEARDQAGGSGSGAAPTRANDPNVDDVGVKFHRISNRDVSKEVPKAVLSTMDKYTKDNGDLVYQRQERPKEGTFYSVHYTTKDKKRMFVRVAEDGKLALGPEVSQAKQANAANPDAGTATSDRQAAAAPQVQREAINGNLLPTEVRRTIEQTVGPAGSDKFYRITRGDSESYVVEGDRNGKQFSTEIAADGKVLVAAAPLGAAAPVAAAPAPTPAAPAPAPAPNAGDAQLAAAREQATQAAAAAPYQVLQVSETAPPARAVIEKETAGATDPLVQRFTQKGQTLYGVHYTTPKGQRNFLAVDQQGKLIVKPRESNWQKGGKDAKFETIGSERLPAPVRAEIDKNGGGDHLFVLRTGAGGEQKYLVQYTNPEGQRMETEFAADGKVTEKPRKAREQPFTILERKGND